MDRQYLVKGRKKLGMTQKQIAIKLGVSYSAYSKYESGERRPSVETAKKIADTLGFNWAQFYDTASKGGYP